MKDKQYTGVEATGSGSANSRRRFLADSSLLAGAVLVGRSTDCEAASLIDQEVAFAFVEPWTDPSEDMAVSWVSASQTAASVEYRLLGETSWQTLFSRRSREFPQLPPYQIHTVVMEGLSPDAVYEIRWPGATHVDQFKTSARKDVTVCFLSDYQSYDFGSDGDLAAFGGAVSAEQPDLLVMNGDYVNDDGRMIPETGRHWFDFLQCISIRYRTRGGALVPLVAITGNHEGRNAADTSNALCNGTGTIGPIAEIFSWSYDPNHPRRFLNSAATLSIGSELFLIGLETDHTEHLSDQLDWFQEQLELNADRYRHVVVAGHAPAFNGRAGKWCFSRMSNAQWLRNRFWPAMEPYADKIRFYVAGHEHIFAITDKLRFDPAGWDESNRWVTDSKRGIRQINSAPWGKHVGEVDFDRAGERSAIDESPKMIAAMGRSRETGKVQVFGEGITHSDSGACHFWVARFGSKGFVAHAESRDGQLIYEISA